MPLMKKDGSVRAGDDSVFPFHHRAFHRQRIVPGLDATGFEVTVLQVDFEGLRQQAESPVGQDHPALGEGLSAVAVVFDPVGAQKQLAGRKPCVGQGHEPLCLLVVEDFLLSLQNSLGLARGKFLGNGLGMKVGQLGKKKDQAG